MGEPHKKHNRKIWRRCPVCQGRVTVAYRNRCWWVSCEEDSTHIPQRFFAHADNAIDSWNNFANKVTNADRIRSMTGEELADWFYRIQYDVSDYYCGGHSCEPTLPTGKESWLNWLKEEVK